MMMVRIQVKLLVWLGIGLLPFTGSTSATADSHTTVYERSVELPEINTSAVFKLENLFGQAVFRQVKGDVSTHSQIPFLNQPIQLVGTLIMAENKIAWIKTGEFETHALQEDQHVPGSQLRIKRILTDSVELVNISKCLKNSICRPELELDLN